MACDRKTLLLISCYADGETTPEETARAEEHLQSCAHCRKLIDEWRGQRQLLEWACTFEIPEEIRVEGKQMAVAREEVHRPIWPRLWRNWRPAVGLAVLAIIGLAGYWWATLPPVLDVGKTLRAGSEATRARVVGSVVLRVSPNSRITRTGEATIRLDAGSVSAEVRHGTGFRVVAPRVEVADQGTRFWVGTGPEIDCVTVEEGVVSVRNERIRRDVKAGQTLVARGSGELSLLSAPLPKDGVHAGQTLSEASGHFEPPASARNLDWRDGLQKLALRFADARIAGEFTGESFDQSDARSVFRFAIAGAPGLRQAIGAHMQEIAQALAGGAIDSDWEVPVGYLLLDGVVGRRALPAGVYYVRLMATRGSLTWRLSGSEGCDVDLPVALAKKELLSGDASVSDVIKDLPCAVSAEGNSPPRLTVMLGGWSGSVAPALSLQLRGVLRSEIKRNDQPLLDELARATAGVTGIDLKGSGANVLCLDSSRKRRFVLIWNRDLESRVRQAREERKRGRGSSLLMGVVASDVPWAEPDLPAGVYLLWWVLPVGGDASRWEVSPPDMRTRYLLASEPQGLPRKGKAGYDTHRGIPGAVMGWYLDRDVDLAFSSGRLGESHFRFGFVITKGASSMHWAEGWIRIKKP